MPLSKKIGRRGYMKYAASGITIVAAVVAAYYLTKPKEALQGLTCTYTDISLKTEAETESFPRLEVLKKEKSIIKTEVEKVIVHYMQETFWAEDIFSQILKSKDEFIFNIVKEFSSTLSSYGKEAVKTKVEFNPEKKSSLLSSEVLGAISKTENRYYATFEWLIKPMDLDFIDDHFQETEQGLSWEGKVNEVPTEIICKFPHTGSPYKAWAHPTGHCHAHVWWEL